MPITKAAKNILRKTLVLENVKLKFGLESHQRNKREYELIPLSINKRLYLSKSKEVKRKLIYSFLLEVFYIKLIHSKTSFLPMFLHMVSLDIYDVIDEPVNHAAVS